LKDCLIDVSSDEIGSDLDKLLTDNDSVPKESTTIHQNASGMIDLTNYKYVIRDNAEKFRNAYEYAKTAKRDEEKRRSIQTGNISANDVSRRKSNDQQRKQTETPQDLLRRLKKMPKHKTRDGQEKYARMLLDLFKREIACERRRTRGTGPTETMRQYESYLLDHDLRLEEPKHTIPEPRIRRRILEGSYANWTVEEDKLPALMR